MSQSRIAIAAIGLTSLLFMGASCNVFSQPTEEVSEPTTTSMMESKDDSTNQEETKTMTENTKQIDLAKSNMVWTGAKVTGEHFGNIKLSSGSIELEDGVPTSGTFVIDMNTMTVEDLKDGDGLLQHLRSDDFFSVEANPEATFELTACEPAEGNTYNAKGNLTIKGITKPVAFPITIDDENGVMHVTGTATVDRTDYDIKFRSGKFFSDLGDALIKDEFTIDLDLYTA